MGSPPPGSPLKWLDRFLSEHLRQAPPSELARHRVLVGTSLLMLLSAAPYLLYQLVVVESRWMLVTALIANLSFVAVLGLLRRGGSSTPGALLLCTILTLGTVSALFAGHPTSASHMSNVLVPALAGYLLGPRLGFLFSAVLIVFVGALFPLYLVSAGASALPYPVTHFWMLQIFGALTLLLVWGISALHGRARDDAEAALQQTLRELSASEGKLLSLIESTQDLVCSLDTQGRLLAANSAWRRLFSEHLGRGPLPAEPVLTLLFSERQELWRERLAKTIDGQILRFEEEWEYGGARVILDISLHPIHAKDGRVTGVTLFSHDITARKRAEERLGEMHRTLVEVSRKAGMAEIATGVLHNVGNTLNTVNISSGLVVEQLRRSRLASLHKAAQLLQAHSQDLAAFLTSDPQGRTFPVYLSALSNQLQQEREAVLQEMGLLSESIEHIKAIVSMQQEHAHAAEAVEELSVPQLLEDALRLHVTALERLGIRIERDCAEVPPVFADRHKLLQILTNLLGNARDSLVESGGRDKRLSLRVQLASEPGWIRVTVTDNGLGIAPEHLPRIFTQGFTTKKAGHGFGLHSSALAAAELKGRLTCSSPGPGQGATFTLELPVDGAPMNSTSSRS